MELSCMGVQLNEGSAKVRFSFTEVILNGGLVA